MTDRPMPERFADAEQRLIRLAAEQAGVLLASRPELAMLYTQGELGWMLFKALCADLAELPIPGMAHD